MVLSLTGLFMFPTVCKVCPLSLCDKSDCGRPWHTGVWPSARDEEYFVESWGKEGIIIFSVRHENISLLLAIRVSGITLDSWHYLKPVSPLIAVWWGISRSSRAMALCLVLVSKDVYHIWAIVSDSISGMSWHCTAWVKVTDAGASLLPPASADQL